MLRWHEQILCLSKEVSHNTDAGQVMLRGSANEEMVRATGIEPVSQTWEAHVLPLNDARISESILRYIFV